MMKGIFRGLRCMFDTDNEKEPEIQIGAPTDVKHVAHIGSDGPSTQAPSWMNEYQGGSGSQPGETNARSQDIGSGGGATAHKSRQSKRSTHGNESSHHKHRKNKSNTSESSVNESSRTRRLKNSFIGSESTAQDTNAKKTRKKQGEGTTRSSKPRNKDPSTADADAGCIDGVCRKP